MYHTSDSNEGNFSLLRVIAVYPAAAAIKDDLDDPDLNNHP